jgi:uncharacterized protein YegP (UPF0339 family)
MTAPDERTRIYDSQQNDVWEFIDEQNGYSWLRIAANKEIVGMSHTTFSTKEAAIANAHLVGYENQFAKPSSVYWEHYQDAKGEYRWRVLNKAGLVLNRAHEGYKTKSASQKNALRHGEGYSANSADELHTTVWMHSCDLCNTDTSRFTVPIWLVVVGILAMVTLFFVQQHANNDLYWPNTLQTIPLEREQLFADVPVGHAVRECINTLAHKKIMQGYAQKNGGYIFKPNALVEKQELAKIFIQLQGGNSADCGTAPLQGAQWAMPYLACAYKQDWRIFKDSTIRYTEYATLGDTAITVLDALNLTEAQADEMHIYATFGDFTPTELITREQLARLLCDVQQNSSL